MEFTALCFFYCCFRRFIWFIISNVKQHTLNKIVETAVLSFCHFF